MFQNPRVSSLATERLHFQGSPNSNSHTKYCWLIGVGCDFIQPNISITAFILFLLPLMRLHYLWPQKSQNHAIPVNLEAIQTTMFASKLFQPLYSGYNQVLHYIVYGSQLSSFDISSAFTCDQHPWTYLLSSNISSRS